VESIEVGFSDREVRVGAIVIPLTRHDVLPSRFLIEGRDVHGTWTTLAQYNARARDQLIRDLIASPGRARLVFETPAAVLTAVRLRTDHRSQSFDGWRLSEIELFGPAAPTRERDRN
jgi:hypothetical protein